MTIWEAEVSYFTLSISATIVCKKSKYFSKIMYGMTLKVIEYYFKYSIKEVEMNVNGDLYYLTNCTYSRSYRINDHFSLTTIISFLLFFRLKRKIEKKSIVCMYVCMLLYVLKYWSIGFRPMGFFIDFLPANSVDLHLLKPNLNNYWMT